MVRSGGEGYSFVGCEYRIEDMKKGVPEAGESSGRPAEFCSGAVFIEKRMTVDELVGDHPGIPYYLDVASDVGVGDMSWEVTKKVMEYAGYMKVNPDSVDDLPAIIFVDGEMQDGAHRTSALWLLSRVLDRENPYWRRVKLRVLYYRGEDVLSK